MRRTPMSKVMLVQPWSYHDEGVKKHNFVHEWRNGPYSLLLLATILRNNNHEVRLLDMARDLIFLRGNIKACLNRFSKSIRQFRPDIIGFSFFSMHYIEVQKSIEIARQTCDQIGIQPIFIAGGIHASTEPNGTIENLGFDYAFSGEAETGILKLADGQHPETIQGIVGPNSSDITKGEVIKHLDTLPPPDWSLCDYRFYALPTFAKLKFKLSRSLDMIMGRGCIHKCSFCAYSAVSKVRYYSAEYLVDQMEYMKKKFKIDTIFFTDSSMGNNRRLLVEFCELMINRNIPRHLKWYGCMRSDQIGEELLKLMWRAGCRNLFYGFESGSQRVLSLMSKGVSVEQNIKATKLHKQLNFPYHASMLIGYPGEREEDIIQSMEFLRNTKPPIIGINCYVPLPGSADYKKLKSKNIIANNDPSEWRKIGEVNPSRIYADIPENRFRQLLSDMENLAYADIPKNLPSVWNYIKKFNMPSIKDLLSMFLLIIRKFIF